MLDDTHAPPSSGKLSPQRLLSQEKFPPPSQISTSWKFPLHAKPSIIRKSMTKKKEKKGEGFGLF